MSGIIGFALVVDIETTESPLPDGVYCFLTKEAAEQFAVDRLVDMGYLRRVADQIWLGDDRMPSNDAALLEFQHDRLGILDWFHIRERQS